MPKFAVAIVGGGIAGLALASQLVKQENIQVDVYEASNDINEIGAGLTLWGRVCEVLRLMGVEDDCIQAAVVVASTSGLKTTTGISLRGYRQPEKDFGSLPFKDAWSLHRADLLQIFLGRVPRSNLHLNKRLTQYVYNETSQATTLEFRDGTYSQCDVLIGCDGIRSTTRAQLMQCYKLQGVDRPQKYVEPRWSGAIAYRALIPMARLAARNPHHSMLTGGQIYSGKDQHVVGYPISPSTLNVAVSITDLAKENTVWPETSWSQTMDRAEVQRVILPRFSEWDSEVVEILECIDSAIIWALHDIEPIPFYVEETVALVGDAAHAAMSYLATGATYAIEDAYILSHLLRADITTREAIPLALQAYDWIRRPYGNNAIVNARRVMHEYQYNGPDGDDMTRIADSIRRTFEESAGIGASGPDADATKAISWLMERLQV